MADAPAREVGAPIGKDEIDPDLVSLRGPAAKVGIVTAAAVVLLCLVLMWRMRADLTFSHSGDAPKPVTVTDVVAGKISDDSYVTIDASLDRDAAVRTRVTESNAGTRVVPVAGTNDKLWVAISGDPWSPYQHDEKLTGRLRPLAAVRFSDAVAGYVKQHPAPRFVSGDELKRARLARAAELALVGGGTVAPRDADELEISVADPGAAVVIASFNPRLPDVKAWTDALVAANVIPAGTAPAAATDETARWEVRTADAVAAVTRSLENAQLWGARVEPSATRHRVPWKDLRADETGVTLPTGVLPWSAVDVVAVWAPRPVPAGARVLLVGESPGGYWYLTYVYVGLALFAALFTWALVRGVRAEIRDRKVALKAAA
ncbi:MAG TPA: hypothetical protein VM261_39470 [Kofleriaceae bacterium]|nr:hypothetical protein [Kofleriaceae bacterium]